MSIVLTEKAAKEVQRIIEDQKLEDGTVLRVGVAGGGCSGFSYSLLRGAMFPYSVNYLFHFASESNRI